MSDARRSVFAHVLMVAGGATVAQGVALAATPMLARLYSPTIVGASAAFLAGVSVVQSLSTGRYELGVPLPDSNEDAAALMATSIAIALATSTVVAALVPLVRGWVSDMSGSQYFGDWMWMAPPLIFVMGCADSLRYWCGRQNRFAQVSRNNVLRTLVMTGSQLLFGAWVIRAGVISGTLLGAAIAAAVLGIQTVRTDKANIAAGLGPTRIKRVASRYRELPRRVVSTNLLNSLSVAVLPIMLSLTLGVATAGVVFLALRIVVLPVQLFGQAIWQVSHAHLPPLEERQRREFLAAVQQYSCYLYALPVCSVVMLAQPIAALLGAEWSRIVVVLPPLALMAYANGVSNSVSYFAVWGLYRHESIWNIVLTGARVVALIGSAWSGDLRWVAYTYGIASSIVYGGILMEWGKRIHATRMFAKSVVLSFAVSLLLVVTTLAVAQLDPLAAAILFGVVALGYYTQLVRLVRSDERLVSGLDLRYS